MPTYNYAALSPQDFEEVSRDLLQAEWNVTLEAFKAGRDSGIDLRYSVSAGGATVIQCKHYLKSGFGALLRHLRDAELPKVSKLNPSRYVVITTVGLTPENKQSIIAALAPFVKSPADVIGADDIDGLLSKHPSIERANFKLWLTSTSVIDRILHNAEVCQTEFEVERIRQKLPLFVQSQAYPKAKEILGETRILVISGPPGIGKTTLAEMLLYSSLEEGYEPVVIQSDISEGKRLYRRGTRQIFYYDDFLGQTFLGDRREYFGQNQDKAVVDFMEMVRRSPDSKFILTTREHILSSAIRLSERLDASTLIRDRFVLKLGHYSFGDRARILYNHLYFSELPADYKGQMLSGDFFFQVIRHPHFNPRLIEWLADISRVRSVATHNYQSYIVDLLENPERIWDHAFRNQISESARCLLFALYSDGGDSLIGLESCFAELRRVRARRYNHQTEANEFESSLKVLEGAFLTIRGSSISFLNPSIKGYVGSVILNDPETYGDAIEAATRFKQLSTLWRLKSEAGSTLTLETLLTQRTDFVARLKTRAFQPTYVWTKDLEGKMIGHRVDSSTEDRLRFLAEFCNAERAEPMLTEVLDTMEQMIHEWSPQIVSLWSAPELVRDLAGLRVFNEGRGAGIRLLVLEKVLSALPNARAHHWRDLLDLPLSTNGWSQRHSQKFYDGLRSYMNDGWKGDWDRCDDVYEKKQLVETLTELTQRKRRARFFASPLRGVLDEMAAIVDTTAEPEQGGGSPDRMQTHSSLSESEVRSMFQTLVIEA